MYCNVEIEKKGHDSAIRLSIISLLTSELTLSQSRSRRSMVYIKFQHNAGIYFGSRDQNVLEIYYTLMFRSSSSTARRRKALLQRLVVRYSKMNGLVDSRLRFLLCQLYAFVSELVVQVLYSFEERTTM